jgi:hypothetical protein
MRASASGFERSVEVDIVCDSTEGEARECRSEDLQRKWLLLNQ